MRLSLVVFALAAVALAGCDSTSATSGPAGPMWQGRIATDPTSNETLMFAGVTLNGAFSQTPTTQLDWSWNGLNGWANLVETGIPRFGVGAYSPLDRGILYYSPGQAISFMTTYANLLEQPTLWLRKNHDWQNISTSDIPHGINGPLSMVYDSKDNQMLLLGRVNPQTNPTEQLWAWNGQSWTQLWHGDSGPQWMMAAPDGGVLGLDDRNSYEWSGSAWNNLHIGGVSAQIMGWAYLPAHKLGVVYSVGQSQDGSYAASTQVFDGLTWKTVKSTPGNDVRFFPAMGADGSGNLLLYGGEGTTGGQGFSDTWSFDGTSWKQVST